MGAFIWVLVFYLILLLEFDDGYVACGV